MAQCKTCGNDYDNTFDIGLGGQNHTFDSFECVTHNSRLPARIATAES